MRALGVRLNGDAIEEVDERGERIVGDTLLLMLNAGDEPIAFTLPASAASERWETLHRHADPWAPARRLRAGRSLRTAGAIDGGPQAEPPQGGLRRVEDWGPMGVY